MSPTIKIVGAVAFLVLSWYVAKTLIFCFTLSDKMKKIRDELEEVDQ
jgi:hypothetical protein